MADQRGPFYPVPAHIRPKKCTGKDCKASIYMIRTDSRWMPVDCAAPGCVAPKGTEPGSGVSHFATCPNADTFRRER